MQDWERERDQAALALEQDSDPHRREEAAELLHELAAQARSRWPSFVPLLPRLLDDQQESVRRVGIALAALTLEPREAEALLSRKLEDPSLVVRMEATGQLADMARPTARAALAKALEDSSFQVRFEAARGMAALQHPAGMEVLVEALEQPELRFRALGALAELGDQRALPALQRIFRRWFLPGFERTQAAGALASLGDAAGAQHLVERAKGRWNPDRALAVELCGELKVPGALELLKAVLADARDPCRGAAARGLGRLGERAARSELVRLLEDREASDDVRLDAAEGLWTLEGEAARAELEKALPTFQQPESGDELRDLLGELR